MEVSLSTLFQPVKTSAKQEALVTHSIHVSAAVRKYLERWFPPVYEAKQYDLIGMWLINALTRKTKQVKCYVKEKDIERWGIADARKFGYMETWQFSIPKRYVDCVVMPKRRVIQFNNMILKFMYAEMFLNMENLRMRGELFYIQKVIFSFRDKYRINDTELADERIRKAYLRYRANNKSVDSEYSDFFGGSLLKY